MRIVILLLATFLTTSAATTRYSIHHYAGTNSAAAVVDLPGSYFEIEDQTGMPLTNSIMPRGAIIMWSGSLTNFDTDGHGTNGAMVGWQLCNGSNGAPDLRGMFIKGWAQGVDPLGTGGGDYTPQGSLGSITISGSTASEASHTHSVTAAGTVTITNATTGVTVAMSGSTAAEASHTHSVTASGTVTITNNTTGVTTANESSHTHSVTAAGTTTITNTTDTGTIAWPAGVPAFAGTTPNVTNVQTIANVTGSRQVATNAQATPAGTISWPTGGNVPTFAGVSHGHTNSFSGSAVTSGAGSAHNHAINDSGHGHTNSFSGSAVASGAGSSHLHGAGTLAAGVTDNGHSHTNSFTGNAVTSGAGSSHLHGAGTLAASSPTFTGTQTTVEPAYVKLAFIIKL